MASVFASGVVVILCQKAVQESRLKLWQSVLGALADDQEMIFVVPRGISQKVVDRLRTFSLEATANVQVVSVAADLDYAQGAWLGLERCLGDLAFVSLNLTMEPSAFTALSTHVRAGATCAFYQTFSNFPTPFRLPGLCALSRDGVDQVLSFGPDAILYDVLQRCVATTSALRADKSQDFVLTFTANACGLLAYRYRLLEKKLIACLLLVYAFVKVALDGSFVLGWLRGHQGLLDAMRGCQGITFLMLLIMLVCSRRRISLWNSQNRSDCQTAVTYLNPASSDRHLNIAEADGLFRPKLSHSPTLPMVRSAHP